MGPGMFDGLLTGFLTILIVGVLTFLGFPLIAGAQVNLGKFKYGQFKMDTVWVGYPECPDTIRRLVLSYNEVLRSPNGGYVPCIDSCYFIRYRGRTKVVRITNGVVIPQDRILLIK